MLYITWRYVFICGTRENRDSSSTDTSTIYMFMHIYTKVYVNKHIYAYILCRYVSICGSREDREVLLEQHRHKHDTYVHECTYIYINMCVHITWRYVFVSGSREDRDSSSTDASSGICGASDAPACFVSFTS